MLGVEIGWVGGDIWEEEDGHQGDEEEGGGVDQSFDDLGGGRVGGWVEGKEAVRMRSCGCWGKVGGWVSVPVLLAP